MTNGCRVFGCIRAIIIIILVIPQQLKWDGMDLKFEGHKNLKTLRTLTTVIGDSDVLNLFSVFEVEKHQDCSSLLLCLIQLKSSIKRSVLLLNFILKPFGYFWVMV